MTLSIKWNWQKIETKVTEKCDLFLAPPAHVSAIRPYVFTLSHSVLESIQIYFIKSPCHDKNYLSIKAYNLKIYNQQELKSHIILGPFYQMETL